MAAPALAGSARPCSGTPLLLVSRRAARRGRLKAASAPDAVEGGQGPRRQSDVALKAPRRRLKRRGAPASARRGRHESRQGRGVADDTKLAKGLA